MSALLIFDAHDSLIFSHCDPKFEHVLVQTTCNETDLALETPASDREVVRNLLTLSLTPYVSALRHLAHPVPTIELPHTFVAHYEVKIYNTNLPQPLLIS